MKTPQWFKSIRGAWRQWKLEARYKFQFESPVKVCPRVKLSKSSFVGRFSYIGDNSVIFGDIKIGRFCSIADGFVVISGDHPLDHLTTHPFIHSDQLFGYLDNYRDIPFKKRGGVSSGPLPALEIGHDVWIGNRVSVLGKVRCIGNGAVVGAGSIVTKDIPPYAIVAGNPAKVIRYRFDEDAIRSLEESQWWNLPLGDLRRLDFSNVYACVQDLAARDKLSDKS